MASYLDTIKKKSTNSQNQALDRLSFSSLLNSNGVSGTPGGVSSSATPSQTSTSPEKEAEPISYNDSSVGLIPGTPAYAEWLKTKQTAATEPKGSKPVPTPDGGPEPAQGNTYTINTGAGSYTIDRSRIDNIVNTLPEAARAAVQNMLSSGTIQLGGGLMQQLVQAGVPIQTLMELQKAVKQGTGMTKQDWMGGRLANMNTGRNFESYRPGWMQKRIDRNYAQYAPEPVPPSGPIRYDGGGIDEGSLPPGYTAIDGYYRPDGGSAVTKAVGPDGQMWGIGPDGVPVRLGGGQGQYSAGGNPNFNEFGYSPVGQPQMMGGQQLQMLLAQLPYFNMYMQGMTPY